MKKINLEQGTELWKSWRRTHITATDSAKICGKSRFGDVYNVWREKTEEEETPDNVFMKAGREAEPFARKLLSKILNKEFLPGCFESEEYPFMGASIDAIDKDFKEAYEIKRVFKKKIEELKNGQTPEEGYIYQCHKQMLVLGHKKTHIFYYFSDDDYYFFEVLRNESIVQEIIEKDKEFWECLINDTPPKASEIILVDEAFLKKEKEFEEIDEICSYYMKRREDLRNDLLRFAIERNYNIKGQYVKVSKVIISRTNWPDVCKKYGIKDIDIQDLKSNTISWKITKL